ncbi:hypothetical protein RJ55_06692 [Drechmeria coniospora]|nr:hypothetical protein RJ55_06692 [Drechmeria coniospora]
MSSKMRPWGGRSDAGPDTLASSRRGAMAQSHGNDVASVDLPLACPSAAAEPMAFPVERRDRGDEMAPRRLRVRCRSACCRAADGRTNRPSAGSQWQRTRRERRLTCFAAAAGVALAHPARFGHDGVFRPNHGARKRCVLADALTVMAPNVNGLLVPRRGLLSRRSAPSHRRRLFVVGRNGRARSASMTSAPGQGLAPAVVAINVAFAVLAVVVVFLRTLTRAHFAAGLAADDWLMVLATVFFVIYCVASNLATYYGTALPMAADVDADAVDKSMLYSWFCCLLYVLSMLLTKLSLACFLLRLAPNGAHALLIHGASLLTVLTNAVYFFVSDFKCRPVSYYWKRDQAGSCLGRAAIMGMTYFYSATSVAVDVVFAVLPALIVGNLNLDGRAKVGIMVLIAITCLANSAVLVRFAYLSALTDADLLWSANDIGVCTSIEMSLAIGAASLATLGPLCSAVGRQLGLGSRPAHAGGAAKDSRLSQSTMSRSRQGSVKMCDDDVYVVSDDEECVSAIRDKGVFGTERVAHAASDKGDIYSSETRVVELDAEREEQSPTAEGVAKGVEVLVRPSFSPSVPGAMGQEGRGTGGDGTTTDDRCMDDVGPRTCMGAQSPAAVAGGATMEARGRSACPFEA